MRSIAEIAFRLKQEALNLYWFAAAPAPALDAPPAPFAVLPDPRAVARALRGTAFAAAVERLAAEIAEHRFPVFGQVIHTGPEIDWRRDYVHARSTPASYFRRIPYLDFAAVGDHKIVWELNRHQHLITLAQAWLLTGREEFRAEIERQLTSWWKANPFQRGINWTSALEVAFRALSWIWVYHLTGEAMTPDFRRLFLLELYRHGLHLEANLSIYFSPNTHLLGEAVALHAAGSLFPGFPRAEKWRRRGREIVLAQMEFQVHEDGGHFEQSTYYHVYALDFFLLHHALEAAPAGYLSKLRRMGEYLDAVMGPARLLACLGDDDGGRVFHPYGDRARFARATLATCAAVFRDAGWAHDPADHHEQAVWWLGPRGPGEAPSRPAGGSRLFPVTGLAVMRQADCHVLADAGPFGYGGAGHSHSDTLSVVARRGEDEILIDPGTFTYLADPHWRAWFRGSAAHNTIRVDGCDQARMTGPFRWAEKPAVEVRRWESGAEMDFLYAVCRGRVVHRRRIVFLKPRELLLTLDEVEGPEGEHLVEQFWHLGAAAEKRLALAGGGAAGRTEGGGHGWRSKVYGSKTPATVIRVERRGSLPVALAAAICLAAEPTGGALALEAAPQGWLLRYAGNGSRVFVSFPAGDGLPDLVSHSTLTDHP